MSTSSFCCWCRLDLCGDSKDPIGKYIILFQLVVQQLLQVVIIISFDVGTVGVVERSKR
jgi:hypothetical protein